MNPYTRAVWADQRDRCRDEVMRITLRSMTDLGELEKYAHITGHPFAVVRAILDEVGQQHRLRFLDEMSAIDAVLLASFLRIEAAAAGFALKLPSPPLLGTLPTGRVNALAIPVPRAGELILAFEAGMFPALWFLGDVLSSLVTLDDAGEASLPTPLPRDEDRTRAISWGAELVHNYLFLGHPFCSHALPSTRARKGVSKLFSEFMTDFVVGHELAHLALHQGDRPVIRPVNVVGQVRSAVVLPGSHLSEIEADRVGMVLMSSAWSERHRIPCWFSAPLAVFYLRFFQALFNAFEAATGRPFIDPEHPPIRDRLRDLIVSIDEIVPDRHRDRMTSWIAIIEEFAGELDLEAAALARKGGRDGCPVAAIWQHYVTCDG